MSAYMVERQHIAYLVDAAMSPEVIGEGSHALRWTAPGMSEWKELHKGDYARAAEVGQMLWDANRASIESRYPDTCENFCELAPGPIGETFAYTAHAGNPFHQFSIPQVLKACHCFAYQACEYKGWKTSEAKAFIDAIERESLRRIPGYHEAEWGVPEQYTQAATR